MSQLDDAVKKVDAAWAQRDTIRGPLTDDLRSLLRDVEGVTGLSPGPGADNLVDRFLDFAEFHADELAQAAEHRKAAMLAQSDRDDIVAKQPAAAEPPPAVSSLLTDDLSTIRDWLKTANPNDVRDALNEILDRDAQVEWAHRLLGWARADGNVAQTFEAINSIVLPPKKRSEPKPDPDAMPDDPEKLYAWVGTDESRAREAYDAEITRAEPRNEVLAFLVDVLDKHRDTPEADAASAPTGEVGPEGSPPGPTGVDDGAPPVVPTNPVGPMGPEGALGPDGAPDPDALPAPPA